MKRISAEEKLKLLDAQLQRAQHQVRGLHLHLHTAAAAYVCVCLTCCGGLCVCLTRACFKVSALMQQRIGGAYVAAPPSLQALEQQHQQLQNFQQPQTTPRAPDANAPLAAAPGSLSLPPSAASPQPQQQQQQQQYQQQQQQQQQQQYEEDDANRRSDELYFHALHSAGMHPPAHAP